MRSGGWLILVVSLLFAGAAGAAPKADYSPIDQILLDGAQGAAETYVAVLANDPVTGQKAGWDAKEALESHIDAALAAAKKKPDLLKATKEYYVAATSYFENAAPTNLIDKANTERAKKTMDEKRTALELELKLVQ